MTIRDPEATATERPGGWTPRRVARLAGPAGAAVFVGGILLAAYVFSSTQSFRWTGSVDQFGVLRHYGIAVGSLLGLVFLWPVWAETTNRLQRFGVGVFAVGFINEAVANGVEPAGVHVGDWHVIGLLVLFPIALLAFGAGDAYAGRRGRGGASLFLGVLYLVNVWLLLPMAPAPDGYSLVGYVASFVLVSVWLVATWLSLRT